MKLSFVHVKFLFVNLFFFAQTIGNEKLKAALNSSGASADDIKINEIVSRELKKEKRLLQEEFDKKVIFYNFTVNFHL